jgi:hypothetical protein
LKLEQKNDSGSHRWSEFGHKIVDYAKAQGQGEGSRVLFMDSTPGLSLIQLKPGQPKPSFNLLELLKARNSEINWEKVFSELQVENPDWFSSPKKS